VVNAKVRLYDASGNVEIPNLKIFGVDRTNWNENTLNGITTNDESVWRSSFGKLRNQENKLTPDAPFIDLAVRNWVVSDKASTGLLTFRITDNSVNLQPTVWYSKEHNEKTPELILTMRKTLSTGFEGKPKPGSAVKIIQKDGQIMFAGLDEPAEYTIYNITGRLVYKGMAGTNNFISLDFPKGIYLFKLMNNKMSLNQKVQFK